MASCFAADAGARAGEEPCDTGWLGLQFWSQWLLLAPGGCGLLPDFALSVAQQFTVGE
ncbi:MAG: hypothetical protein JNM25_16670 [Planctomycetes bacterium]|nr:hypothetical protein [Planctomycetota bacterium]